MTTNLRRITFLLILIGMWEGVSRSGLWQIELLPPPSHVIGRLLELSDLGTALGRSVVRLLIGFTIAVAIGIPFGVLIGSSRLARDTLGQAALGFHSLPAICWLPIGLVWFGESEVAIQFVVVVGATFAIATATGDGITNIPPIMLRAGQTLGAHGVALYTRVLVPAGLPAIVTGLKMGWVFAWRALMSAELLFAAGGLGNLLQTGRKTNDMSMMFAVMLIIVVVGRLIDWLVFDRVERSVRRRFGYERA